MLAFDQEDDVTCVVNEMLDQLRTQAESFRRRRPSNIIGLLFHAMTPALRREDNLIVRVEQNIVESLAEEPVARNALREVETRWAASSPAGSRP